MAQQTRAPTSDVAVAGTWTGSAGTRFQSVDDHPDTTPTDVITLSTAAGGNIRFGISAFTVESGSTAVGVSVQVCARRNGGGAANVNAILAFNNGNTRVGTAATPGNGTISTHNFNWGTGNPSSGTAWTVDEVNGIGTHGIASIGVISTDANPTISVSSIQITVDYTPPPVTGTFSSTLDGVTSTAQGVVSNPGTFASTLDGVTAAFSGEAGTATPGGYFSPLWMEMGGAGLEDVSATGTFSSTLAGVTSAFSGSVTNVGTFASTLADVTATFSGAVEGQAGFYSMLWLEAGGAGMVTFPSGEFASTLDGVTAAFSGTVLNPGSIVSQLEGALASFSGVVDTVVAGYRSAMLIELGGMGAVPAEPDRGRQYDDGVPVAYYADLGYHLYYGYDQLGIPVNSRDSIGAVSGEFASTLGGVTMAAEGLVVQNVEGTIASTLAGVTAAFAGDVGNPEGEIEATLEGVTADFTGLVTVGGPIDSALAGVTMSASGFIEATGLFASSLAGAQMIAAGLVSPHATGTFASTLQGVLGTGDGGGGRSAYRWLALRIGL